MTRQDTIDIVKLVQESIFEACYLEMGMNRQGGPQGGFSNGPHQQTLDGRKGHVPR